METMMKEFNDRIRELKICMLFRTEGTCEEADEVLRELRDSLSEIETRVSQMLRFLGEEKAAIERTDEIRAKLQSQHDHLEWINQHLPKHLPGNIEYPTIGRTNVYPSDNKLQEQDTLQEIDLPYEENPFYVPQKPTNNNFVALGLSYITVTDFNSIPKYLLNNRISRDKVNEAIDDFNKVVQEKYTILNSQQSSLNHNMKQKYWEYKGADNEETRGKDFITENDLKTTNQKINFKMDANGRAIISILRHCGKIKEVRGGGQIRYVVIG
ncbi:hypothetical protein RclHR1_00530002 [Rhizophagus clarus]|uniref:Spindle and kinetochore-associated protein 1-like n=1 Tax=Rhizophagus clarus TaxID=94130 RepID=A0A2Z6SEF6_9GLOM|nr:hypothetical protein RclHR1_00530002 [Rhizophagus clarus]GES88913.1 spindle and kinetochore-associated protein 1-like [Rhizophagus clarus]